MVRLWPSMVARRPSRCRDTRGPFRPTRPRPQLGQLWAASPGCVGGCDCLRALPPVPTVRGIGGPQVNGGSGGDSNDKARLAVDEHALPCGRCKGRGVMRSLWPTADRGQPPSLPGADRARAPGTTKTVAGRSRGGGCGPFLLAVYWPLTGRLLAVYWPSASAGAASTRTFGAKVRGAPVRFANSACDRPSRRSRTTNPAGVTSTTARSV